MGMKIMVNEESNFEAVDIVAIISPALAAVGTVAAGIFGYSLALVLKVQVRLNKPLTELLKK